MELYQRLEIVLSLAKMPKYLLAQKLGCKHNTFSRYFCAEQQEKLKMHLWEIAQLFPDINRNWLFFEEGKMLTADEEAVKAQKMAEQNAEIEQLKAENRRLTTRLLVDGVTDEKSVNATARAAGQE